MARVVNKWVNVFYSITLFSKRHSIFITWVIILWRIFCSESKKKLKQTLNMLSLLLSWSTIWPCYQASAIICNKVLKDQKSWKIISLNFFHPKFFGKIFFVSLQQVTNPSLNLMPLLPPSYVGRASRALETYHVIKPRTGVWFWIC